MYKAKTFDFELDLAVCGSPITTNFSQASDAYELSSPGETCSPLFFEESEPNDLDLICLLSPNSKASALFPKSKRIQKRPVQYKEVSVKSSQKKSLSKSGRKRNMWSESEDQNLLHYMSIYGTRWSKIASHLSNRTGKQVRDRYLSALIANINKEPWTKEEDRMILEMLKKIGPQWCKISDCFEGRTDIHVKNRYYTYLKKHGLDKEFEENTEKEQPKVEETAAEEFDPNDPTYMISYQIENSTKSGDSFFRWENLGLSI